MTYDEWKNAKAMSNPINLTEKKGEAIKQAYNAEYRKYAKLSKTMPRNLTGEMNRREFIPPKEYKSVIQKTNKDLDNYGLRESKWNGKIRVKKDFATNTARIDTNNGIELSENCCQGSIVHELLHLRSYAYSTKEAYLEYKNIEEAIVQLLTEELEKAFDKLSGGDLLL